LFRRDNFDLEMEEEIRTHLEMKRRQKWTMAFRRLRPDMQQNVNSAIRRD